MFGKSGPAAPVFDDAGVDDVDKSPRRQITDDLDPDDIGPDYPAPDGIILDYLGPDEFD
jgi:hypothetical protein